VSEPTTEWPRSGPPPEIQAFIARQVEARAAIDAEMERSLHTRMLSRRRRGPSPVFTLRLSPDEIDAIERRAAVLGLRPTQLARNLIREGLEPNSPRRAPAGLSAAVERLADAVADVRDRLTCTVPAT
jgi:hypothetical protein